MVPELRRTRFLSGGELSLFGNEPWKKHESKGIREVVGVYFFWWRGTITLHDARLLLGHLRWHWLLRHLPRWPLTLQWHALARVGWTRRAMRPYTGLPTHLSERWART